MTYMHLYFDSAFNNIASAAASDTEIPSSLLRQPNGLASSEGRWPSISDLFEPARQVRQPVDFKSSATVDSQS